MAFAVGKTLKGNVLLISNEIKTLRLLLNFFFGEKGLHQWRAYIGPYGGTGHHFMVLS